MKSLFSYKKDLGQDGVDDGAVEAAVGVEGGNLIAKVQVGIPIATVVDPATRELDKALDKLKDLIPGDWDSPMIDKVKLEYKEALVKALSEQA